MRELARWWVLMGASVASLFVGCRTPRPSDFLPASGAYLREDRFPDPIGEEAAPIQYEAWAVTDPGARSSVLVDRDDVSVGLDRRLGKGDRAQECARATEGGHRATLLIVDEAGSLRVNGKASLPAALLAGSEWPIDEKGDCGLFGRVREVTEEVVSVEKSMRCGVDTTVLYVEFWQKGLGRTRVEGADGVVRSRTWRKPP